MNLVTDQTGFLLLGGPQDGLWVVLPEDARDYSMSEANLEPLSVPIQNVSEVVTVKRHVYRREHIYFPDGNKVAFMIHETLTPSQAMVKLLKSYKP